MGVVDQPVENAIGGGGIGDLFVPTCHRQLGSEDGRAGLVSELARMRQNADASAVRSTGLGFGTLLFRPHYMTWSEQLRIEFSAPEYMKNVIRLITETGLRVYKELALMRKDQVDLANAVVWIPDSKTPNGVAEVPLSDLALEAIRSQMLIAGDGPWLFPSDRNPLGHQGSFKKVWMATLRRACVPYFRIYDLRSTYATRLSAGGVADEWVTQLLRQGDAKVFKKYSQMKLQMKREALQKLNRQANEMVESFDTVLTQVGPKKQTGRRRAQEKWFRINIALLRAVSSVG